MPYDVGVSQYLQGKGVSSNDIGYDQNSGNVTVRGQNFYKPELNMAGTTYSNQTNLDNAYGNYSKSLPVIQPDGSVGTVGGQSTTGQAPQAPQSAPKDATKPANGGYANPYTQTIADIIKHLTDSSNAPAPDIYSSPQYAAAKANQDRQSADAVRHANESAAGAGLGHSTIMTDRSQRIQDDSNNYLQTQLVPQIMGQLQTQRQTEMANERAHLNDIIGLSDRADSQHNADRTFDAGRQDATTTATGIWNPSGKSVQDVQAKMDANSKAYATATPEEQQKLHDENIQLAGLLGKTFDPNTGKYSEGQGFVGTKTIQAKQIEQALATGQIDRETAKFKLDQLKDPNSPINQADKINLELKKIDLANAPEEARLKIQDMQKRIDQIGAAPYRSPEAKQKDQLEVEKLQAEVKNLQNKPATGNFNLDDYKTHINNTFYVEKPTDPNNQYSPKTKVFDPIAARGYILGLHLTDDQTDQMLKLYGMPTK